MQLGIGSYAYAWSAGVPGSIPEHPMTAHDLVTEAAGLGVGLVQICDNMPLHGLGAAELDDLAGHAAASRVRIQVGTRGSGHEHLVRYLDVAARLSSPMLRIVVDSPGDQPAPAEVVRRLRELVPELDGRGIDLAVENHDRFTASTLASIVRDAGSPRVGICLDTVNSFGALEGPAVVIDTLLPLALNIHVKDFAIRRHPSQLGFVVEGRAAGDGRLDVRGLLARAFVLPSSPDAILELWVPPEATLEQTIATERAWVRRSVAFLAPVVASVSHAATAAPGGHTPC